MQNWCLGPAKRPILYLFAFSVVDYHVALLWRLLEKFCIAIPMQISNECCCTATNEVQLPSLSEQGLFDFVDNMRCCSSQHWCPDSKLPGFVSKEVHARHELQQSHHKAACFCFSLSAGEPKPKTLPPWQECFSTPRSFIKSSLRQPFCMHWGQLDLGNCPGVCSSQTSYLACSQYAV